MRSILLLFLLLGINGFSQSTDSLKKYSYVIYSDPAPPNGNFYTGTCFFIKKDTSLFLITAAHVFNGHDPLCKKNPNLKWPVLWHIFSGGKEITINSDKWKSYPCKPYYQVSDMAVINIDSLKNKIHLNSIEAFTLYGIKADLSQKQTFSYGYPGSVNSKLSAKNSRIHKSTFTLVGNPTHAIYFNTLKVTATNVYMVKVGDSKLGEGCSGAPVFFLYENYENGLINYIYAFGGLVIGGNDDDTIGTIVKPNEVINAIDSLSRSPM